MDKEYQSWDEAFRDHERMAKGQTSEQSYLSKFLWFGAGVAVLKSAFAPDPSMGVLGSLFINAAIVILFFVPLGYVFDKVRARRRRHRGYIEVLPPERG